MGTERGVGLSRVRAGVHTLVVALVDARVCCSAGRRPAPRRADASTTRPGPTSRPRAPARRRPRRRSPRSRRCSPSSKPTSRRRRPTRSPRARRTSEAQDAYDAQVIVADELAAQADDRRGRGGAPRRSRRTGCSRCWRSRATATSSPSCWCTPTRRRRAALPARGDGPALRPVRPGLHRGAASCRTAPVARATRPTSPRRSATNCGPLAEEALDAARAATRGRRQAAVAEQQEHQVELEAQLAVLVEKREATEADYQAGVVAREKAGSPRSRAAAAAAAAAGSVNSYGWARPSRRLHLQRVRHAVPPDLPHLASAQRHGHRRPGLRRPHLRRARRHRTYAGWNGTLGNYIQINHGDGTSSGYGHIIGGGILVGYGQSVHAGQQIARVGTTGASTGCHLHFIIRVNGQLTEPGAVHAADGHLPRLTLAGFVTPLRASPAASQSRRPSSSRSTSRSSVYGATPMRRAVLVACPSALNGSIA